ncbi:hypothetical protein RUM43_002494 [Polyplax serrata]|uniref:Suppressor of cytokine signaling 7 n=1 Tax=Polyplax serrata TaxID=468196 RepID=A0AAN8NTH7_POLSC
MAAENVNWVKSSTMSNKSHETCSLPERECWSHTDTTKYLEPPPEFQDNIEEELIESFAVKFVSKIISEAYQISCKISWSIPCSQVCHMSESPPLHNSVLWNGLRLCWTPELFASNKPASALSTCLSTSHNSLSTIGSSNIDVSDQIKTALSHDILTSRQISDMYNVPFDSDIYALPVDRVQNKKFNSSIVNRTKTNIHNGMYCHSSETTSEHYTLPNDRYSSQNLRKFRTEGRNNGLVKKPRFSSMTSCSTIEPIHVTVDHVRQYLRTLYVNSKQTSEDSTKISNNLKTPLKSLQNNNSIKNDENRLNNLKCRSSYIVVSTSDKTKENVNVSTRDLSKLESKEKLKKWSSTCRPSFTTNIKETLCNIFRKKRLSSSHQCLGQKEVAFRSDEVGLRLSGHENQNPPSPITKPPFSKRALPPLPKLEDNHGEIIVTDSTPLPSPEDTPPQSTPFRSKDIPGSVDFASSIEKVKDCGWYWGPISGEAAEKILSNEPDGSFIVRDSSDDYYIFSLTFKLNSIIRHVRIEHDQGNFSFGSSTRFKSHTIVDFIESAVEHSRSGRYLFFLHRRPVLGPMRVQLLHPVSRFKQVQSLQHMCRFVILKVVRRDLIRNLPLPRRILDYLSTPHYYSENLSGDDRSDSSTKGSQPDQLWTLEHS